ncbi:NAD(P)-dependent oxidoreductase [Bradyrhizobium sp. NAS80.1]|uniref:NAD(P)-dependent oxidoreductase n=1 Tax=Bradyrhizobium sp. NAS80.1 TaxID=1680159 RepID=UPI000A03F81B|nr:NAD(P)-dependent oxidoreductase [Bradyrhizobium sp. NAS80.1]
MTETSSTAMPGTAGQRIGLIGAGRKGTGIGLSLLRHGSELHIKVNRTGAGAERLTGMGAHEHTSFSELARHVSAVVLSLPSSCEVEEVCLGQHGLFAHLPRQSLVLDCTTSYPASTLTLAEHAKKHALHFIDAPVTRSPQQAEQGRLNAIVGSDESTFPIAARVLSAFCENIVHVGNIGQGHKLKLVYNSMTMGIAAVAAEACQLAIDVDLAILRSLVSRGATNSGVFRNFAAFLLDEKPDALAISIRNANKKDIDCGVRLANETALKVPVLSAAAQKFQTCLAEGKGELTLPHLALSSSDDEPRQK